MKLALLAACASADVNDMLARMQAIEKAGNLHKQGFITDAEFADMKAELNGSAKAAAPRRRLSEKRDDVAKSKCLASQVDKSVKASAECMDSMTKSVAPAVTGIVQYLTKNGGGGGGGNSLGEKAFDALYCVSKKQEDNEDKGKNDKDGEDDGKNSDKLGGCVINRLKEIEEEYVSKADFLAVLKMLNLKYEDGKLVSEADDGLSEKSAALSCAHIAKYFKQFNSGTYWVKRGGEKDGKPAKTYCDMAEKNVGDIRGWTMVYKMGSDRHFNQMNIQEYQIANMASVTTNNSGKFSDADINKWLSKTNDKVIRYVGERSATDWNIQYTKNKEFCNNDSPACSKSACAKARYPTIHVRENPQQRKATGWKRGWIAQGGIPAGHANHGNCHGAMNACNGGWINNATGGHMCTWIGKTTPGIWFNYGPYAAGRYRGHFWILGMDIKELQ